jgi:hypothetical protein
MGPSPLSRVRYPQAPAAWRCAFCRDRRRPRSSLPLHAHTAHTPAGGNTAADRTRGRPCAPGHSMPRRLRSGTLAPLPSVPAGSGASTLYIRSPACTRPATATAISAGARAPSASLARLVHRCRAADAPGRQAPRALASAMPCMQVRMHEPRRPNLPGVNLIVKSIRHAGACARACAPSVRASEKHAM